MADQQPEAEPLPIWFFVGLILIVNGLLVMGAAVWAEMPPHVVRVTETAPGLWWGALLGLSGLAFLVAGLRGRKS